MSELTSNLVDLDFDDPRVIEEQNNRKLTADKIRQILSKVENNPGDSSKRWVWELIQNAKDVPNTAFERVSIQLILTKDKLIFKHNGDPFTLKNIFSLIQQVSSKDSTNADEEVTGKFGTGFISTHLLSKIIEVEGVVKHRGIHRNFKSLLDRSGNTSEEMLPKIEKALNHIRDIENDEVFPKASEYELRREESSLDTVFTYFLDTEERLSFAEEGLKDLVNTLPLTLVYLPKIKKVEVLNELEESEISFSSELKDQTDEVSKFTVTTFKDGEFELDHNFITYSTPEVSLAVEVEDFENMKLIPHDSRNPRLFRDFPLIGSQKFHFPFILNGFKFNPTEDRDGILLHSKEGVDAVQNREIIENAYEAATKFTDWLIENDAKNRFITVFSKLPDEKWSDASKPWIEEQIKGYREFIYNSEIVETAEAGIIKPLSETFIPKYGASHESKLAFYELVKFFKGATRVPQNNNILDWIEFVGPTAEEELWPAKIYYGLEDLLTELSELGSVQAVSDLLKIKKKKVREWINQLIEFLVKNKESELLKEYAIIPNHNNDFLLLEDLYLEATDDPIADEFLDLVVPFDDDWRDYIIHSSIKLAGISVEKLGLSDLSAKVNEVLKEKISLAGNRFKWKFKERDDAKDLLIQILQLIGKDSKTDSFKNQIFYFGKEIFGFKEELISIDRIENFRYENALKFYIELINDQIEETENISGLADSLEISNKEAKEWIDNYIKLLKGKTDFESLIKHGEIIPNRYEYFCAFEDLKNYGTPENPLDEKLLDILFELDEKEDWRIDLVHECISIPMAETIKFEELGSKIQEITFEIQKSDLSEPDMGHLEKYRNCLLDLIDWANKDERAEKYLKSFKEKSNELFYKLTMRNSNLTVDEIKMLADPESKSLMKQISNSNLSKKEIQDLIARAELLGSTSSLLKYADDLLAEKQNMEWLLKVGSEIEKAFLQALENESLNGELKHTGSGSFDFKITNSQTGKSFFIELKSYANGSTNSLRFAPSQAERAINSTGDFAICLIERPFNQNISTEYIKSYTKSVMNSSPLFTTGFRDYKKYCEIIGRDGSLDSRLRLVLLERERIEVTQESLLKNSIDFQSIIEIIKRTIS
ncbi:sacsin N-terminal ATP-binding-like domain-containing protein [Algoriphagus resistens]|uniref:sacsin N-terminal ATP-binding-like domain-containing protein n=1 Tax=Algoriphagus resistens TaxID=1750590 RepID=UPI0007169D00|nr:hypothetical protein [Algoriphagus resistens]